MDLSKLIQPQWVFHSETAGDWDVYFYSVKAARIIEKHQDRDAPNAIEAIRAIMGVMLKSHVDDQEDGEKSSEPTEAEVAAFTDDDVIRFSREFLENDKSFEPDPEIERREGQSDADYLLSVLAAENKKQSAKLGEMFTSLKGSLGGLLGSKNLGIRSVSEDLLKQSEGLESLYGTRSGIWGPSPAVLKPIDIPPNPIHETNERLGDMTERLENLVGFGENALRIMNGLQVASAEFLENFSKEAEKNSKAANKAILVGIFAIVFSVAQIAYNHPRRDRRASDGAGKRFGQFSSRNRERFRRHGGSGSIDRRYKLRTATDNRTIASATTRAGSGYPRSVRGDSCDRDSTTRIATLGHQSPRFVSGSRTSSMVRWPGMRSTASGRIGLSLSPACRCASKNSSIVFLFGTTITPPVFTLRFTFASKASPSRYEWRV